MRTSKGKALVQGDLVRIRRESVKVGVLGGPGNAVRVGRRVTGLFALVQWYYRGRDLEKIAYNVTSRTVADAKKEMATWMPRLQFPEHRESSVLIGIVRLPGAYA